MDKRTVRDWMTTNPITIHPQQTLPQAYTLMKNHNVRRLPVVEEDRLIGIVTFGDIREAQPSDASALSSHEASYLVELMSIDSIMTPDPFTIQADEPISEAARQMLEHKIGGIPVVDAEGNLIGIITETDICRVVLACAT